MRTPIPLSVCVTLMALCPLAAHSIPITYSFSTGTSATGNNSALVTALDGMSVTGTFDYDSSSPATGTVSGGAIDGSTIYNQGIANLAGSVGSNLFSDLFGGIIVGDDVIGSTSDFFRLSFNIDGTGFNIGDFALIGLRIDWIEGPIVPTDFLSGQGLPDVLFDFPGRLALDFASSTESGTVFFSGATVTSVPEPATLSLLAAGLLGVGLSRRKRFTTDSAT